MQAENSDAQAKPEEPNSSEITVAQAKAEPAANPPQSRSWANHRGEDGRGLISGIL